MKKKLCGAALAFAVLIGLLHIPARAVNVLASGECGATGNDITWTLDSNGLFSVNGVGAMRDYSSAGSLPWYNYRDQITAVEIHEGVTSVGNNAFRTCSNIALVSLPESLTSIGDVAFYQCSALSVIVLPDAMKSIGANAFGYCALQMVTIPAGVTKIGASAFFRCSDLTDIDVDPTNAVYSAADGVLFDKLDAEGTDPEKPALLWYPAAKDAESYAVPAGIKKIGDYAFQNSKLQKVTLPSGVIEIGEWAFSYNSALTDLELPKSLKNVKDGVVDYGIKDYAFYECVGLSTDEGEYGTGQISFEGSRQDWADMKIGTGNYRLTNARVIPADMQQDNVVASGECGALGSNASWSLNTDGDFVISGNGEMLNYGSAASVPWVSYDDGSGGEPKDLRPDIKTVTVEGTVTRNDAGVITAQRGVTNVGDYSFYNCENLTSVTLPPTLTAIGAQAFSGCPLLADVNLSDTQVVSIGDYAFNGSSVLTAVDFPETLATIGKRAFLRSGLEAVEIPASVEEIGEWAFRWCDSMNAFSMEPLEEDASTHYTAIGDYALADCVVLEDVSFTENLTVIGEYAFSRCVKLMSVSIPSSVSGIGACAFYACSALTAVEVDEENQTYASVTGMLLNKDQTCIYYYPAGRPSDACAISQSVNSVTAFAFDGASSLKDVYYEGNQSQWDASVKPNIGAYNDPLLNATLHCEGPDPNDFSKITSINAFTIDETEEGLVALATIQCGEETLGVEAFCATYDAEGRFLGMESQEISPGTEDDISFTLSETAVSVSLFLIDGEALPCCRAEVRRLDGAD